MTTPTQVRRPWTTTLRTVVQTAIGAIITLGIVVPAVVQAILDGSGDQMPDRLRTALLAVSGVVVLIAGIVARIMAIPQVELLLRRYKILRPLAAQPNGNTIEVVKHGRPVKHVDRSKRARANITSGDSGRLRANAHIDDSGQLHRADE